MGKQSGVAVRCGKTMLMIFNSIFLVISSLFLAVGIFIALELHKYVNMSADFSPAIPYVSVGVGGFMLMLGVLSIFCTSKGQPVLLYIYAAFLLVVLVLLAGAGISAWAYRVRLKNSYEEGLEKAFTGYGRSRDQIASVDSLQKTLQCCGIHNATDWIAMPFGQTHNPPYPVSCCRTFHENTCMLHPQGCYTVVVSFLESQKIVFAGIAIGVGSFQLFGVLFACCLAKSLKRKKSPGDL